MSALEEFVTAGVFTFILIFVRFGTALMIMPGIGDSFTPMNIRLHIALAICLVMTPIIQPFMPNPIPPFATLIVLIVMEFVTGLFIGTISRIMIAALDTAGMLISMASGISNAQMFNPTMAMQGSLFGAFLSVMGVTMLFVTNLHHLLIHGLVESYHSFPVGNVPDTSSMAELVAKAVGASFMIGFQISIPFVIISLMIYIGMGVLSRLMPQIQVFILAIPIQILLALFTLSLTISAIMLFWTTRFEESMIYFLSLGTS